MVFFGTKTRGSIGAASERTRDADVREADNGGGGLSAPTHFWFLDKVTFFDKNRAAVLFGTKPDVGG